MEAAFKEKELLIREMNHRIKNNLSLVAAMLSLQARRSTESEVREQLGNAATRVNNFALVHDRLQLFRSSVVKVDAASHFEELLRYASLTRAGRCRPNSEVQRVDIGRFRRIANAHC
jgi:two-component system, sensor histidine kinase PdtaS